MTAGGWLCHARPRPALSSAINGRPCGCLGVTVSARHDKPRRHFLPGARHSPRRFPASVVYWLSATEPGRAREAQPRSFRAHQPRERAEAADVAGLSDGGFPGIAAAPDDLADVAVQPMRGDCSFGELPDAFGWTRFRAVGRKRDGRDVRRHGNLLRFNVEASAVDRQGRVFPRKDRLLDHSRCAFVASADTDSTTMAAHGMCEPPSRCAGGS